MAKAYFYIKNHVQEVGYRVFVMSRILESNLKGGAINTPDGRVKVLLKGRRKDILSFIEELKKEKPELAKNPVMTQLVFSSELKVPDEIRLSHALEMNQFGKAVKYLANLNIKIDNLPKQIGQELKMNELPAKLAQELKMDELPKKLAQELKMNELPVKIAQELKMDKLPKQIAEEFKKAMELKN